MKNSAKNLSFGEHVLKYGVILLVPVVTLLVFKHRVYPDITSKVYPFAGAVDLLVIVWLVVAARTGDYIPSRKGMIAYGALFLFVGALALASAAGVDLNMSLFSTFERGTGLVFLFHALLFAFMALSTVRVHGMPVIRGAAQGTVVAAFIVAVATFSNADAILGNTSYTGAYFVCAAFIGVALLFIEQRTWLRYANGLFILTIAVSPIVLNKAVWTGAVSLFSLSSLGEARAAAIATGIGAVLFAALFLAFQQRKTMRTIGYVCTTAVVAALLFGTVQVMRSGTPLHERFNQLTSNREAFYAIALRSIKERPLLGYGAENFPYAFQQHFNPQLLDPDTGVEIWTNRTHNTFLDMLIFGGIIGLISYLLVLAALFAMPVVLYRSGKLPGGAAAALVALAVAYVIQGQLLFDTPTTYMIVFFLVGAYAGLSHDRMNTGTKRLSVSWVNAAAPIAVAVWIFGTIIPAHKSVLEAKALDRSVSYERLLHPSTYAMRNNIGTIVYEAYKKYLDQPELTQDQASRITAVQDMESLLAATNTVWTAHSNDYFLTLNALRLSNMSMYMSGNFSPALIDRSRAYGARAQQLSPGNPLTLWSTAETEVYARQFPAAHDMLLAARDTYPELVRSHKLLLNFERLFGTKQSQAAALAIAKKYFPDYQF